jgi:hypothetical protein
MTSLRTSTCFLAFIVIGVAMPAHARAQVGSSAVSEGQSATEEEPSTVDLLDLLRYLRKAPPPTPAESSSNRMIAWAPVISSKPGAGLTAGVFGNIAFFTGERDTTTLSSAVAGVTGSVEGQVRVSAKHSIYTASDRWFLEGDQRFFWTSEKTYGLGTGTEPGEGLLTRYELVRVHETAYRRLVGDVYAGAGFLFDRHMDIRPGKGAEGQWESSPVVTYSRHYGFDLAEQTSAGPNLTLLVDTRDHPIDATRGWRAEVSYRLAFEGLLGGDSTWQQVDVDLRTYRRVTADARHKLAFWALGSFVTSGTPPYLDLPATGLDIYGRSGRAYAEGRFRGEELVYAEVEYRGSLMRNGLLGMVLFANTQTISNKAAGERLFDTWAPGAGVGLRALFNKRSKTNLCLDFAWGRQGAFGVYLSVQEAF